MKFERIDENRIKITVSIDDLLERNIEFDHLNCNSKETQELFWDMMKKAEAEFGFSTSDAQLSIEAIPDASEGFVITITKIEDEVEEAFESIQKYIRNKYKKSDLRAKKRSKKLCSPIAIYSFSNTEDLKQLCQCIVNSYSGESALYSYAGEYYLVLKKSNWTQPGSFNPLIQEYGKKISYVNFYEGLLEEYGKKISERNAINVVLNFY